MGKRKEAEISLMFSCGCGFATKDPEEAKAHADAPNGDGKHPRGHVLDVLGMVTPKQRLTDEEAIRSIH